MTSAPLLAARDLRKRFGGVLAVNDASIAVPPQSITALIGPNGAGKTTLFNLISGFLRPERGTIHFAGRRTPWPPPVSSAPL